MSAMKAIVRSIVSGGSSKVAHGDSGLYTTTTNNNNNTMKANAHYPPGRPHRCVVRHLWSAVAVIWVSILAGYFYILIDLQKRALIAHTITTTTTTTEIHEYPSHTHTHIHKHNPGVDEDNNNDNNNDNDNSNNYQEKKISTDTTTTTTNDCLATTSSSTSSSSFPIPSFVIAGAQKAGTTALYYQLAQHPNLIPSSPRIETHFFDRHGLARQNLEHFQDSNVICEVRNRYHDLHFADAMDLLTQAQLSQSSATTSTTSSSSSSLLYWTFEKTPAYMVQDHVPTVMRAVVPWTRIVFVLRNPVDRLLSQYRMRLARHTGPWMSLEDVLVRELAILSTLFERGNPQYKYKKNKNNSQSKSRSIRNDTADDNGNNEEEDVENDEEEDEEDDEEDEEEGYNATWTIPDVDFVPPQAIPERRQLLQPRDLAHWKERSMLYRGCYADHLQQLWMPQNYTLENENLLVLPYEWVATGQAVHAILQFIGAPWYNYTTEMLEERYGPEAASVEDYEVSNRTLDYLYRFYEACNYNLADLLGEEWRDVWKPDAEE